MSVLTATAITHCQLMLDTRNGRQRVRYITYVLLIQLGCTAGGPR